MRVIMIDFLNSLKSIVKEEKIHIDNNVFKLHYKFTVILLVVFSILLSSKQYFGDPIDCDVEGASRDVIDTYCWIYGTYIVKENLGEKHLPGLGNDLTSDVSWQKYYQWVSIVLSFQALLFYLPRYLWKTWEGGRIRMLAKDLGGPLVSANWTEVNKARLISYMISGKYAHSVYALRYTMCEVLNFLNSVVQIFLMNWLLTGQFTLYGFVTVAYEGTDAMNRVFPKLTKCKYFKYGPSGNQEIRDALCILPLNILNEKLFLIFWFWLFFLTLVSFLDLVYRICVFLIPKVRIYILMAQTRHLTFKQAQLVIGRLSYGDFFVLYRVGKNVNPLIYRELVVGIYCALSGRIV